MVIGVDIRCLQDSVLTGVGEYTWRILKTFHRQHPEVKLVGYCNAAGRIALPAEASSLLSLVRSRWPNKLKNLGFSLGLAEPIDVSLKRAQGQLDVLWIPNPGFVRLSGQIPTVLTIHDLSFIHYPEFFRRRPRWWYFPEVKRLLRRDLPRHSRVVAVSQHTADDVAELFPRLRPCLTVITPGVGEEYSVPPTPAEQDQALASLKLPPQFLLALGTIEPRKNYLLLLRAYELLLRQEPNYPFDLVIAGVRGWRTRQLTRYYSRLMPNVRSRIRFVGYVTPEQKRALYTRAVLFLYPSIYEGFGIPPLEALASGVPVLVSASSSLPEVVGEAGVLLNPYRHEVWSRAIQWLTYDEASRDRYSQLGRKQASQFSWQASAARYYELFSSLAPK